MERAFDRIDVPFYRTHRGDGEKCQLESLFFREFVESVKKTAQNAAPDVPEPISGFDEWFVATA